VVVPDSVVAGREVADRAMRGVEIVLGVRSVML
jgi:hypothetical protein